MTLHVVSVGTSTYTNYRKLCTQRDQSGKSEIPNEGTDRNISVPPPVQNDDQLETYLREHADLVQSMVAFVHKDSGYASAELNAMGTMLDEPAVRVHLIGTDTAGGKLCTRVLHEYLKEIGVQLGEDTTIPGYYKNAANQSEAHRRQAFEEGTRELYIKVIELVHRALERGEEVKINATGGFKPDVAVLTLIGTLFGIPVYYRHEFFQATTYLPAYPWPDFTLSDNVWIEKLVTERRLIGQAARDALGSLSGWMREQGIVAIREGDGGPFEVRLTRFGYALLSIRPSVRAQQS